MIHSEFHEDPKFQYIAHPTVIVKILLGKNVAPDLP